MCVHGPICMPSTIGCPACSMRWSPASASSSPPWHRCRRCWCGRQQMPGPDVLLVANNFPPVRGGSAVVYANLAAQARGRIMVLAPSRSYSHGWPLIGWREHDRRAAYRVVRLPLLRTVIKEHLSPFGKLWHLLEDLAIRVRLCWVLLRILRKERPRAVCIGELLASGWLVRLLAHMR